MSKKKAWSKSKAPAIDAAAADGKAAVMAVVATGSEEAVNEAAIGEVIEGEVIAVESAVESEPDDGLSIVDADELKAIELDIIETPLTEVDEAALEAGIASVFDSILAEGLHVAANDDAGTPHQEDGEAGAGEEAHPTLALLAELNRLWAQPLAA